MVDLIDAPRLTSLARGGGCGCKLDPAVLSQIIDKAGSIMPPQLMVDASTRDDAAVYRVSDEIALVATTDFFMPIVDDPFEFGRIAATNALSDIYAMGATPIFCLAIVGMPVGQLPIETVKAILDGGRSVADAAGAPVAGGHSIESAEPIYGLVALGVVHPDKVKANSDAKAGDVLILGKPLGIGIYSAAMKRGILGETEYAEMIASTTLLNTPGADLPKIDGVHAITDVTGFGLLGHLREVCEASDVRAVLKQDDIPIFDGARKLVADGVKTGASGRNWAAISHRITAPDNWSDADRDMLCDPQTSGGLLVSCTPQAATEVLALFHAAGHVDAAVIGQIEAGEAGIVLG